MVDDDVDRLKAAAEAQLDRVDDEPVRTAEDVPDLSSIPAGRDRDAMVDDYGIHVDDPDRDTLGLDMETPPPDEVADTDVLDAIAETFNARNLEGLIEHVASDAEAPGLLGYDVANLPVAIEDLWVRRPTCLLTRGLAVDEHVGVLWEHDGRSWWQVAVLHVDDVEDGRVGVIEFSDDTALLERVTADAPGSDDLDDDIQWQTWEDGVTGSS